MTFGCQYHHMEKSFDCLLVPQDPPLAIVNHNIEPFSCPSRTSLCHRHSGVSLKTECLSPKAAHSETGHPQHPCATAPIYHALIATQIESQTGGIYLLLPCLLDRRSNTIVERRCYPRSSLGSTTPARVDRISATECPDKELAEIRNRNQALASRCFKPKDLTLATGSRSPAGLLSRSLFYTSL